MNTPTIFKIMLECSSLYTILDDNHRVTVERISLGVETYTVKHSQKYSHLITFSEVLTHVWGCWCEWF